MENNLNSNIPKTEVETNDLLLVMGIFFVSLGVVMCLLMVTGGGVNFAEALIVSVLFALVAAGPFYIKMIDRKEQAPEQLGAHEGIKEEFNRNLGDVDLKDVINEKFSKGEGVLMLDTNMPDDFLLLAVKQALKASQGKSFTVVSQADG